MLGMHACASTMNYLCLDCSGSYTERPPFCGQCLPGTLVPVPAAMRGRAVELGPRRRVGPVPAGRLRPDDSAAPYSEPWSVWRLGVRHALLLFGPPGSGKSTVATRMAVSAARRVEVLYVAVEEGHSVSLRERLVRAGLDDISGRRLRVTDARDLAELAEDLGSSSIVVIDSLSELSVSPLALVEVLGADRSWVGVAHANTRGGAYGGHEWGHAVDAVVRVDQGIAAPVKNRFGPMDHVQVFDFEKEVSDVV